MDIFLHVEVIQLKKGKAKKNIIGVAVTGNESEIQLSA